MKRAAWTWLDWTTYLFCLSHIPATLFVDLTPIYPDIALLRPLQWLRSWYLSTFADPLMGGQSYPGAWFKCFLWIEGIFQLPVCILLVWAYHREQQDATWARLLVGLYSIQVATSTIASLAEIFAFDTITLRQKLALCSMFWPYVAVPVV
ncbi:transmembrane protein 6/97, partial [Protomyces lactucae-debilis]